MNILFGINDVLAQDILTQETKTLSKVACGWGRATSNLWQRLNGGRIGWRYRVLMAVSVGGMVANMAVDHKAC